MKIVGYSSKTMPNEAFHFSASIIELEFQPIGFLISHVSLFRNLYPKIEWSANFDSVFSNAVWFYKKKMTAVLFSIIKRRISIDFMHL